MPDALEYVSELQQKEFEESLMDRPVTSFPIAMIISWLTAKHWGYGCYIKGHGFVRYCKEMTDELLIAAHLHTGLTYEPGLWCEHCGILAIDWEHSWVEMGPSKVVSFADMTLAEFDRFIDEEAKFYYIPGTDQMNGHGVSWEHWYPMSRHCDTIGHEFFFDPGEFDEMDTDRPWYLLPSEYAKLKRLRAELKKRSAKEPPEKAMRRMKGRFYFSEFHRSGSSPWYELKRVDSVKLVDSKAAWKDIVNPNSNAIGHNLAIKSARDRFARQYPFGNRPDFITPEPKERCKDKKLVRVDTSSVSLTSTSAEARKSHFYLRLKDWIPYDRPDVTRKASLPRERHDHSVPFFSVDRTLVEAFARDMRKSDPVKAIRDTYADMLVKLDKLPALPPTKIRESEYAGELHWELVRSSRNDRGDTGPRFIVNQYDGNAISRKTTGGRIQRVTIYKEAEVDKVIAHFKKAIQGKWIWWHDCPVLVDHVFAVEGEDTRGVESTLGKDFIAPYLYAVGRYPSSSDGRSKHLDDLSENERAFRSRILWGDAERSIKDLKEIIKPTTLPQIIRTARKSCKTVTDGNKKAYDAFIDGIQQLLDGKSPEFDYPIEEPAANCE
jgi:hypothetical protein